MQEYDEIIKDLSSMRINTFKNFLKYELKYQNINNQQVYYFYLWSELVNGLFWQYLSRIEIILRNKINYTLIKNVHKDWLLPSKQQNTKVSFGEKHQAKIQQTINLLNNRKLTINNDRIIAELNLGFWVHFLKINFSHTKEEKKNQKIGWEYFVPEILTGYTYQNNNYHSKIRFWNNKKNQDFLYNRLRFLNILRNRIAHHEHIFKQRDKTFQYQTNNFLEILTKNLEFILQMINWLSPNHYKLLNKNHLILYTKYLISPAGFSNYVSPSQTLSLENFINLLMQHMDNDISFNCSALHISKNDNFFPTFKTNPSVI